MQMLEVLTAVHNAEFCKLHADESFRPKLHYLIHYPDQMLNFGPLRNHWCMRFESKNGFLSKSVGSIFVTSPCHWLHITSNGRACRC